MRGRPLLLTAEIASELAELWTPEHSLEQLGKRYGVSAHRVSVWGRMLGLPTPKPRAPRCDVGRPRAHRSTSQEIEEMLARIDRVEIAVEPIGEERPTCFVCHAPSPTWDGHDDCTGRRRKAA